MYPSTSNKKCITRWVEPCSIEGDLRGPQTQEWDSCVRFSTAFVRLSTISSLRTHMCHLSFCQKKHWPIFQLSTMPSCTVKYIKQTQGCNNWNSIGTQFMLPWLSVSLTFKDYLTHGLPSKNECSPMLCNQLKGTLRPTDGSRPTGWEPPI